jgi:REP element-mobilizing transposase RayT
VIQSVKGRLCHLVRRERPKPFRNKYSVRSIGSATRKAIENYVRNQVKHHAVAAPQVQALFERYQICNQAVDLSAGRMFGTGVYWYNLYLAFVHADRFRDVRESWLAAIRKTVLGVSAKYKHLLSRCRILADHVHLTLGAHLESPRRKWSCAT